MWANFRLPVLLLANVRTLFLTSFFTSFFLCFFCFHIFLVLIVKQIFEEKGNFIFIFLQIP